MAQAFLQLKFRERLSKLFYKQEIINISKRNGKGKRQKEIMVIFPFWNMDVMKKKMTFCAFVGHERYKLFWSIFIVIVGVPPSSFVIVSFLFTS